jgi:hypothetical protein
MKRLPDERDPCARGVVLGWQIGVRCWRVGLMRFSGARCLPCHVIWLQVFRLLLYTNNSSRDEGQSQI